ncbi:MAG TPA: AraC family transcriptional regulator [Mycobacteriales bacterium]|nr:AraC family transcriptional regulator [Mycobacteriales bacterium]
MECTAWRPAVPGVAEVFHASFADHAYPSHTHDTWTLLIVDDGLVRYDLDRHEHGAMPALVTLLPPHVPHDGRAATPSGFRKRVLYLDAAVFDAELVGRAVDEPGIRDAPLRDRISRLHAALSAPGEVLQAESRLALVSDRVRRHLQHRHSPAEAHDPGLAARLRDLLDASVPGGLSLQDAASRLQVSPAYLVRAFTREYGLPPHRYLTGRRLDLARRLLLDGRPPALVATEAGFYDQSHLTRHFRRLLGTTPSRYATSR